MGPMQVAPSQQLVLTNAPNGQTFFGSGPGGTVTVPDLTSIGLAILINLGTQLQADKNVNIINGWATGQG